MAFSGSFRDYEAGRLKRAGSGPFARFQTLFDKYRNAGQGAPEIAQSKPGLPSTSASAPAPNPMAAEERPTDNASVSEGMSVAKSTAETDTTFNDEMSKAIKAYNQATSRQMQRDRAALAGSPNRRVSRRA
jgi:hypothetical protein